MYLMPATTMLDGMEVYTELIGRPSWRLATPSGSSRAAGAGRTRLHRKRLGFGQQPMPSVSMCVARTNFTVVCTFVMLSPMADSCVHGCRMQFEWHAGSRLWLPRKWLANFYDFGWNKKLFPGNATNHKQQLDLYHDHYHIRFGGIRKPRLGNSGLLAMARSKDWLLHNTSHYYAGRGLNFSKPALRAWYANETNKFLEAGVDFYLDDEGENTYFEFYYWNLAQREGLDAFDKQKRLFTISRAWTPGMQRVGATSVWTGDVPVSWDAIRNTPTYSSTGHWLERATCFAMRVVC